MYLDIAYLDKCRIGARINPKWSKRTGVSQIKNQGLPGARSNFSDLAGFLRIAVLTKRKYLHPDLGSTVEERPPSRDWEAPQEIF